MMQVESWGDEIIMTGNRDDLEPHDKRVRCDNLKWLMSKLAPKRYGERLLVAGDAENPIQHLHAQVSLAGLTDDQLTALDPLTFANNINLQHISIENNNIAAIDPAQWQEVSRVRNPAGPDDSAAFSYVTYRRQQPH